MRDQATSKRFFISFFVSLLLHSVLIAGFYFLYDFLKNKTPKAYKIENLLVLKRGRSLDRSANTPGAKKPSLSQQSQTDSILTPPTPKTLTQPKPSTNQAQNKNQAPSKNPLPTQAKAPQINNKNLKLFMPNTQPSPAQMRGTQNHKGMDVETIYNINELYGDEWGDLGEAEKDFVTSNLREIARITQSYLEYPMTAAYLRQHGENAIEFYLLPNGDIEGLKLLRESGFVLLDKNSLKTIEVAFKDYPRPSHKTLIRFRVTYYIY